MKDRQPTQVLANGAIRYGIYNADGSLNRYEYMKREDAPTVEGTPLNKANLLSDATAAKIWPGSEKPDDPTVNDALAKLAQGTARVGDIAITSRTDLSAAWLPCDGRTVSQEQYPALCAVLRTPASPSLWMQKTVLTNIGAGGDAISYENGHWFRTYRDAASAHILVSDDGETWTEWAMPQNLWVGGTIISSRVVAAHAVKYLGGLYVCSVLVLCVTSSGNTWRWGLLFSADLLGQFSTDSPSLTATTDAEKFEGTDYDVYFDGTRFFVLGENQDTIGIGRILRYTTQLTNKTSPATSNDQSWRNEGGYAFAYSDYVLGMLVRQTDSMIMVLVRQYESRGYNVCVKYGKNLTEKLKTTTDDEYLSGLPEYGDLFEVGGNVYFFREKQNGEVKLKKITGGNTLEIEEVSTSIAFAKHAVVCSDQLVGVAGTSVYVSEDITQGWDYTTTLSASAGGQPAAAGTVVRIPGASANTAVKDILHDFAYDNKKIPTITTDTRSKAYIKALEE
nr:MAG TPA: LONG TAIL FIBER PROTEIN P37 PROTEIN, FIBER PROTEIN.2A [Caudoviricetes sp.]